MWVWGFVWQWLGVAGASRPPCFFAAFSFRAVSVFSFIKLKIHSSCEIEDFVEISYLQAVCDTAIARITGCVSSLDYK